MFFKKIFKRIFIYFLIFIIFFCWVSLIAEAVDIPNPLTSKNFKELMDHIINFLFTLALAVTPLMLIIAGYYYILAAGEPKNIQTAHDIIKWTLIGFIVILMSKGIINFLMKNVFNKN